MTGAGEGGAAPGSGVPARAVVDFDDALAIVGFGGDLVDRGLDARLDGALSPVEAETLVARLDLLRRALQVERPRGRGVGLIGRLMGRDVLAEADDAGLRQRVGVLLLDADRAASSLADRAAVQAALQADLDDALAALAMRVAQARDGLAADPAAGTASLPGTEAPRARFERRLQQLDTVHHAWAVARAQLAHLHDQNLALLARHRRIRDVLLPAWRQQALSAAGGDAATRARRAAGTQAAIASEVAAMTATLEPDGPGPTSPGERP